MQLETGFSATRVLASASQSAALQLRETPETLRVLHPSFAVEVDRKNGETKLLDATGAPLAGGFLPHVGRRFTEGEYVRAKNELTWTGAYLRPTSGLVTTAATRGNDVVLHVTGQYARPDAPDQSLTGGMELCVHPDGTIDVTYDYAAEGRGMIVEAGLSLQVPASASEFRWMGAGPYAGYPGKDALNEFGRHHLGRGDLYFQGNRRRVELALLTEPGGRGVALGGTAMDVAVERDADVTIFSHNSVLSGRGTKFVGPDVMIRAESHPRIAGSFTIHPLTARWPAPLTRWLGDPTKVAKPFQPFFHSYDQ
jgi:beta-galactosidase